MEHEYNGNDFMSDLVTLYRNIQEKLAKQSELEHFGQVAISHVRDNLDAASLLSTKLRCHQKKEY